MASTAFTPTPSEDSVDIYEDLDSCDGPNTTEHVFASPAKLKESLDLYEEIVKEEQHTREASFNDLKVRFLAAQGQIKELHRRLQQMEIQNNALNTENYRLKKNISALLRTAKQEVLRKDMEIQRLSQYSEKNHHRLRLNHYRDRTSSSANSSGPPPSLPHPPHSSSAKPSRPSPLPHSSAPRPSPPPRSSSPRPSPLPHPSAPCSSVPPRSSAPRPSPPPHSSVPPSHSPLPPRSLAPPLPPPPHPSSALPPLPLSPPPPPPPAPPAPPPPATQPPQPRPCSTSLPPLPPPTKHQRPSRNEDNVSEVTTSQSGSHKSGASKSYHDQSRGSSRDGLVSDKHSRLTGESVTSHSNRHGNVNLHKSRHREEKHKQSEASEKRHRGDDDTVGSRSHKSYPEHKHESRSRRNRDHKSSSHRRIKSPKPEVPTNSESESRSRERRQQLVSEGSKEASDHHLKKTMDGSRRFDSKDRSKSLRDHGVRNQERRSKDHGKKSDRRDVEVKKLKRTVLPESSKTNSNLFQCAAEVEDVNRQEEPMETSEKPSSGGVEKSPNRKLSFMETLNLTQSPVKKPSPVRRSEHQNSGEDEGEPPALEDMCVIDEVGEAEPAREDGSSPEPRTHKEMPESDLIPQVETVELSDPAKPEPVDENEVGTDESDSSVRAEQTTKETQSICPLSDPTPVEQPPQTTQTLTLREDVDGSLGEAAPEKPDSDSQVDTSVNGSELQDASTYVQEAALPAAPLSESCQPSPAVPSSPLKTDTPVNLDTLPQEGISLPEAILVLTQAEAEDVVTEPSCAASSVKVSLVTEDTTSAEKHCELKTPEKTVGRCSRSNLESPLLHDEESMLRTLSNLRKIPDAISPLSSPIRISKRGLQHSKPGFVKSLQKEFISKSPDPNLKKLDVNKENKYPGSPAKRDSQDLSDLATSVSETELEEGEILSDDEATGASPATKRAKLMRSAKVRGSPKTVLKKKTDGSCEPSKDAVEGSSVSPLNKSRFKTVCPASTKSCFSTTEEVMETFKSVRSEIRKKYMKLHKTFPRKSFYGVMENFQESFMEFVDVAHFGKLCSQSDQLKIRLKKLITTVFSKVANNGIVKRIFDQQAVDLKQKLWDFVDNQMDYLFKDISVTLKELCRQTNAQPEEKRSLEQKVYTSPQQTPSPRMKPCPYKTGLGSRGKDIKINLQDSDSEFELPRLKPTAFEFLSPRKPSTPDKNSIVSLGSSILDKTDFEILTEQQASSLTFNLVRDSQMGEIFKCLLQGSDLLESGGDSTSWPLGTPRKDGDRVLTISTPTKFDSPSKLLSPGKFETPSKLIATWSTISPRKISSPQTKIQLNPALFDESCLMEVPSGSGALLQSTQKTYSILAEDLAVSLTIPSPLKSDSHLSFLQPPNRNPLSTPESVLSAHFSEDALMDGDDVSEHDIHLALDTDNSSCGSGGSVASQPASAAFVFKPNLPVQAMVMERSNDHFVLKIRQSTSQAEVTIVADESMSRTLTEEPQADELVPSEVSKIEESDRLAEETSNIQQVVQVETLASCTLTVERKHSPSPSSRTNNSDPLTSKQAADSPKSNSGGAASPHQDSCSPTAQSQGSESERNLIIAEDLNSSPDKRRKRKKPQKKSKAKRSRKEERKAEKETPTQTSPSSMSPNSLSAKNVVKKKGEVVIAWTRDEDRTILIELKTKGASRDTFATLSEKLKKPSEQISQRFHQLMKLFKKQGKS